MGMFYVNHTVKTESRDKVAAVPRQNKFTAYVSPARSVCGVRLASVKDASLMLNVIPRWSHWRRKSKVGEADIAS